MKSPYHFHLGFVYILGHFILYSVSVVRDDKYVNSHILLTILFVFYLMYSAYIVSPNFGQYLGQKDVRRKRRGCGTFHERQSTSKVINLFIQWWCYFTYITTYFFGTSRWEPWVITNLKKHKKCKMMTFYPVNFELESLRGRDWVRVRVVIYRRIRHESFFFYFK